MVLALLRQNIVQVIAEMFRISPVHGVTPVRHNCGRSSKPSEFVLTPAEIAGNSTGLITAT